MSAKMTRPSHFVLGAITGSVVTLLGATTLILWLDSPTRQLRQAAGVDLGMLLRFAYQREERDQFLGQGSTLRIFYVASDGGKGFGIGCPASFVAERLETSEIWSRVKGLGLDGATDACVKVTEEKNREDIVAVSRDRVFHLRIDR